MPTLGVEGRYPFFGENDIWNSSVNLTKVLGPPQHEGRIVLRYTTRPAARSSQFNGRFNFDRNTSESSGHRTPVCQCVAGFGQQLQRGHYSSRSDAQFSNVEWFIQDSWRVRQNITIDGGIRFYRIGPTRSRGDQLAVFQPASFNPANAPQLIQPVNTADGRRGLKPGYRRDSAGGQDRYVVPGLRESNQRHSGL